MKECRKGRQKRLIEVYEHLRSQFGIHTKSGFAESIHYGRTSLSAALNGKEEYLTKDLFEKICETYPGVFNLEYLLTGEGQLMAEDKIEDNELFNESSAINNILEIYARMIRGVDDLRVELQKEVAEVRSLKDELKAAIRNLNGYGSIGIAAENINPK